MWKLIMTLSATWKVFDAIPNEEKKEIFLWVIEKIENNPKFQNAKKYWDALDEDHKSQYYNDWWGSIKYFTTWPLTPRITKKWLKINIKDNLYTTASPLMRLWVSFWLLDKPKDLTDEKIIKNIKKDAHNINKYLKVLNFTCKTVPELREFVPFVTMVKPYAEWYESNWAPLMHDRIRNKQIEKTEESILETLYASEESILEQKVAQNKVA